MARLDGRVPVVVDGLRNLALARPHELTGRRRDPADRIVAVWVRVGSQQIGGEGEWGWMPAPRQPPSWQPPTPARPVAPQRVRPASPPSARPAAPHRHPPARL